MMKLIPNASQQTLISLACKVNSVISKVLGGNFAKISAEITALNCQEVHHLRVKMLCTGKR